jgi:hypothetical protein
MFWIALAAAAQLSSPVPTNFLTMWSPDDMPAHVQSAGVGRVVPTRTIVKPDGSAQDCSSEGTSGDAKLDVYTCALILKRARFQAARWTDGSPAYGVFRSPVIWAIGAPPSKRELEAVGPADVELSVNRLPKDAGRSVRLRLALAVDETGKVVDCAAAPKVPEVASPPGLKFPELVPVACQLLLKRFNAVPVKDASGKAVRSVQVTSVKFTLER